jgi:hypothetical protein
MEDPLSGRSDFAQIQRTFGSTQFADDVLSRAMDGEDRASFQAFGLACWQSFEGIAVTAEDNLDDAVAADAIMDSAGDGLDLWQLRHWAIVRE